jgi:hypothetical protein
VVSLYALNPHLANRPEQLSVGALVVLNPEEVTISLTDTAGSKIPGEVTHTYRYRYVYTYIYVYMDLHGDK